MFPPGDFPHAVPSFRQAVIPPDTEPDDFPIVCLVVNEQWLPFVQGALSQLLLSSTWEGDDAAKALAQQRAMQLRYIISLAEPCTVCPVCPPTFFIQEQ